ncbi:hypothetical protein L208DRAFT_1308524 [Tricholoma matsutake]|nr:hypothetical protein L208DRAFT_1308524 [Tricholoma matsutake 945]
MAAASTKGRYPQDIVAIFHASFHPTLGHVIDWSLKASDDLNLDNVEFSALPSGLHLVDQDVVYFTKDEQHGVCVFRRRKTVEKGHRGFRLSSLGILLAKSSRPRPWLHTPELKELMTKIISQSEGSVSSQSTESLWEPARAFFDERKVKRADLGGAGDWNGWSNEFDEVENSNANPILHLSHLLRILGPSSLTLHKYILGRQRILIYTLPPVEAACILCQVAADMCYDVQQQDASSDSRNSPLPPRLKARCRESINVLGMITLNDTDRLRSETQHGRGWIACTTDAMFLEKPSYYDLLIDLTTSTPSKATRPTFYMSKPIQQPSGSRGPTHCLSTIRFSWSDIKLWNELERILRLDSEHNSSSHYSCCGPTPSSSSGDIKSRITTTWSDVWRVYEDVCVICAGLWVGSWRNNSTMSYSTAGGLDNWGKVRLEGDDDLSLSGGAYMRNLGMGIEGGPPVTGGSVSQAGVSGDASTPTSSRSRGMRRTSGMSWSSSKATVGGASSVGGGSAKPRLASMSPTVSESVDEDGERRRDEQVLATLSLLQTLHAHALFQLSVLESFIPHAQSQSESDPETVYLSPKEVSEFELSPLSASDAKYLEWLALEYAGTTRVVVKRGWRDLLGAIFGYT